MRTKRFVILALAVCLFSFLPNLAQAFYNPQTGHWLSRDPIGERGGVNLYDFIGNNPVQQTDFLGLDQLSLKLDSTEKGWDTHAPSDNIYITDISQVLKIAKESVGDKYDVNGTCGNCIKKLIIASHGGGGGEFTMGASTYNSVTYKNYLLTKSIGSPENLAAIMAKQYVKDTLAVQDVLSQLAKLRCKRMEITILACDAGAGTLGKLLRQQVLNTFGPNTQVTTYEEQCGYAPVLHIPTSRGDLFQLSSDTVNNDDPPPIPYQLLMSE